MEGLEYPQEKRVPRIEDVGTPEFRELIHDAMEAPAAEDLRNLRPEDIEKVYKEASALVDIHNVISIDPMVKGKHYLSNDQLAQDIEFAATQGVTKGEAIYILELLKLVMERLEIANKRRGRH